MAKRIYTKASKTERAFELFLKISNSPRPVAISELDEADWGSQKTIGRLLRQINETWEQHHGRALFQVVNADGEPAEKGERFLRFTERPKNSFRADNVEDQSEVRGFSAMVGHAVELKIHRLADGGLGSDETCV